MKLNIMNIKPEITDEEIRSYMNFDGLLKDFKSNQKKPAFSAPIKIISFIGGIIIIAFVSYFLGTKNQIQTQENLESKTTSEISKPNYKNDIPVFNKDSSTETKGNENNNLNNKSKAKSLIPGQLNRDTKANNGETKLNNRKSDSTKATLASVYLQAEPLEGFPHLYDYFSSELKYPEEAVKDSIQGIVTVSFIITKEGKPEKIIILNSLGQVFDKEVVRLIEHMPAWKPAIMNHTPVPSKISMPLTFRLERIKNQN